MLFRSDAGQHPLPQSQWRIMYDGYVKLYGDADDEGDLGGEDDLNDMFEDREQFRNLYYVPEFSHEEIDALVEAVQLSPTLNNEETEKLVSTLENEFTSVHYRKGISTAHTTTIPSGATANFCSTKKKYSNCRRAAPKQDSPSCR